MGKRIFVFIVGGATRSEVFLILKFSSSETLQLFGILRKKYLFIFSATSMSQVDNQVEEGGCPRIN